MVTTDTVLADPLDARIRPETADPTLPLRVLGGFGNLHPTLNLDRNQPWTTAVAALRHDPVLHWPCAPHGDHRVAQRERADHRLRVHADGSITLLDHPDRLTGGHLDWSGLGAEAFLLTLGATPPTCAQLAVALMATGDLTVHLPLPAALSGWIAMMRVPRARTAYAAALWAQEPVWPARAWERFLTHGVTPTALRAWLAAGWRYEEAMRFLSRTVPFPLAERWRVKDDTSPRAARLAALGETPADEAPWRAAGFTPADSEQWRGRRFTPQQAWDWHRHRVRPAQVADFQALVDRPTPGPVGTPGLDLDTALTWSTAGVPSDLVLAWYRQVGPDGLDTALAWHRHLPPRLYPAIGDWNHHHPDRPITPQQVTSFRSIGLPADPDLLARILDAGLTRDRLLAVASSLEHTTRRWLGREARTVLLDAAAQAGPTQHGWAVLRKDPVDWPLVGGLLRGGHWPVGWQVLVDWLTGQPAPR